MRFVLGVPSRVDVDIVCVGFGPATAGFLATLSRQLNHPDGTPRFESSAAPGLPPQVLCYERADDLAFGVSGAGENRPALRNGINLAFGIAR